MIETKIIVKSKGNSGTGNSSGASGYGGEYVPEADYAARAGKAKKAESADLAMRANTANTADRAKYADKAGELDEEAEVLQRYIRKDIDDIAQGTVTWEKVQKLLGGLLVGEDFSFDADGNIIAHSIASENANEAEHKGFSIIQTGLKTGKYKLNINELLAFSKAKVGDKFVFDAANDFRFDAEGNIIAHSITSENANKAEHKGFSIIQTGPKTGKYKLNINELLAFSKAKVGDKFVFDAANDFRFDADGNIIAHSIASENANTDEEKGFIIVRKDETGKYKLCIDELLAFSKATIKKQAKIGDKFVFDVEKDFKFDAEGNVIAHSVASENANATEKKGFIIAKKDDTGRYKLCVDELLAWGLATVKQLHVKGDSTFDGNLFSKQFVSDFLAGKGWGIYNKPVTNAAGVQENKWTGEFDNVIVRGSLRVYEMIISQLLGENDNRVFTGMMEVDHYDSKTGKVYLDTQDGKLYNPFRRDDIIMVQQFNGMPNSSNDYYVTKNYELLVTDAGCGSLENGDKRLDWVKFTNFTSSMAGATPETLIKKKDTFVRVDNLSDPDRKGIMQIITVGTASPHLDVIYGLKTDPEGALKGRLGNLEGIVHPWFGRLQGFGEYLNNLYAVGDLILRRTGESVDTKFQVLENMFSSRFAKTSYELTNGKNYLENGQFLEQISDADNTIIANWEMIEGEDTELWVDANGLPFMVNGSLSTSGNRKVSLEQSDGRQMLRIQNCGLRQANADIKQPGTHKEYVKGSGSINDAGLAQTEGSAVEVQDKLYVNVRIYAKSAGQLTYGFEGCKAVTGKVNELAAKTVNIAYSGEWQNVGLEGKWNGTGDFIIRYSGDCYIAVVSVTDEPLSELSKTVSTQIIQTASNIKLLGENINKVNGKTTQLGIDLDAEKGEIRQYVDTKDKKNREDTSSLITQTSSSITSSVDKKLKNQYDTITSEYSSSITQKADQITLKVSAAQTAADNAQSAADAAQGTADTAKKSVAELKVTIYGISTTVANKADTSTLDSKVTALNRSISSAKQSAIDTLNARIDGGVAEFYKQASPPSFTNLSWTSAECQRHAGALWYVVEPGTKGYVTGHLYRFVVMRGTGGAWEDVDESIDSATTVQQNASGWNVASGMFDAKGNLTASGVASITPTVTTIANKSIDDKKEEIISGLMVKSDFSSLFSKAFDEKKGVVQADISTFVTKTAAGEMISNATIQADQISLTGHCLNFTGGQITITTDNFKLDKSGNMWCQNGTFSGTVTGVHGSFKNLDCVDSNGNVVGSIQFGSDGRMWFSGDMYHQGMDTEKKRGYRFYASDLLCRGMFGHRQKVMAYVFGTYMNIYTKDSDDLDNYVKIPLVSGTESGKTYYKIPLYGFGNYGDASGFAIDVVVINCSSDYYYVFEGMGNGKEWRVINGNNNHTIHFADIGGWHDLKGGESLSCVYVAPRLLFPRPSGPGAGVFWSGEYDLNWS